MNADEIKYYIARNCNFYKMRYFDVVSADEFLKMDIEQIPKPFGIVINSLDRAETRLTGHWVACFCDRHYVFYWDSLYNNNVQPYSAFIKHMRKIDLPFAYNKEIVQNVNSDLCGMYTVVFFYYMLNGCGYDAFLKIFKSNDVLYNDECVKDMFYRMTDFY